MSRNILLTGVPPYRDLDQAETHDMYGLLGHLGPFCRSGWSPHDDSDGATTARADEKYSPTRLRLNGNVTSKD